MVCPKLSRRAGLIVVLAGAAAFYRIGLILSSPQHIVSSDAQQYLILAKNLAAGNPYSLWATPPYYPDVFRSPGYPAFLAVIFRLGGDLVTVCAAQTLIQILAVLAVAKAIEGLTSPAVAMGAYVVGLFSPFTASISCLMLSEALVVPLVTWFAAIAIDPPRRRGGILLGAILGLLALTRGLFVPAIPLAMFAILAGSWRNRGVAAFSRAAFGVAAGLAITATIILGPYALWNRSHHGSLSVTPIAGFGRAIIAHRGFVAEEVTGEHWAVYENLWTERERPTPEEIVRIDNIMKESSLRAISRDPMRYVLRTIRNEIHIWFGVRFLFPFNQPPIPGILLRCLSISVLILAFMALHITRSFWREWSLALIPFAITAVFTPFFYVIMRYSTPVYGPFEVLAGAGFMMVSGKFRRNRGT